MEELQEYFITLLKEHRSIDIADAEFKKVIADDPELRHQYSEWCHDNGSSERNGFRDFCEEYMENMDSIWETLTDYNE